jgi:dolichyl-phosphate-mannose-protein mannosyltransferase
MKRIALFAALSFGLCLFATYAQASENTIVNGNFEAPLQSSIVTGWDLKTWNDDGVTSFFRDHEQFADGLFSVRLHAPTPDDSRIIQHLTVKPDTLYHISAMVRTEGVEAGAVGANLSAEGANQRSQDLHDTEDGGWRKISVWGRTGSKQTEMTLCLRLGFYGSLNKGTVWFDSVEVQEAQRAPAGETVIRLYTQPSKAPSSSLPAMLLMLIIAGIFFTASRKLLSTGGAIGARLIAFPNFNSTSKKDYAFIAVLAALALFKLISAGLFYGYNADIGTFSSWALNMAARGPWDFYQEGYFADYPPLYMYVLWVVGGLANLFKLQSGSFGFLVLLKLPSIIADFLSAWVLFRIAKRRGLGKEGAIGALLLLFNPVYLINSSFWGQVDSIFTLVLLLGIDALEDTERKERGYPLAGALYALAILLKPQALLVAPVGLAALICNARGKVLLKTIGAFILAAALPAIPFLIFKGPLYIFSLYGGTLGSYNYMSLNAFNLYTLMGLNWAPTSTKILGITGNTLAWALVLSSLIPIIVTIFKSRKDGVLLWAAGAIFLAFFTLAPKMHERYLFPMLIFTLAAAIISKDRRLWLIFILASLSAFINIFVTLELMVRARSSGVPGNHLALWICSAANLGLLVITLIIGWRIFVQGKIKPLEIKTVAIPATPEPPAGVKTDETPRNKKNKKGRRPKQEALLENNLLPRMEASASLKNTLLVSALTLIVLILGVSNLGSTKSPQEFWEPRNPGANASFDFGKQTKIDSIMWHHGLGTGTWHVELSPDNTNWMTVARLENDNRFGQFRWQEESVEKTGRFIRISKSTGSLQMNEIAIVSNGAVISPPTALELSEADAVHLFDEPDTVHLVSTWYNRMYFDEIYHARSAWEQLLGLDATENTHPPLGKLIIAVGIKIFGMNPFGWRVMGALFGALMIPFIYLIARRLLNSVLFGMLAAFLFSFDFMRFTQSRIATIDVYAIFFILASYAALLVWMQTNPFSGGRLRRAIPLLLSGIAVGLGAGAKWICLYADVGLAILFFAHLINQISVHRKSASTAINRWAIEQILVAIVCFVAIPIGLYIAAYIPYMLINNTGLEGIIANQKHMWSYHANVTAEHPYSSQWYTWPLMIKPMWYYSGASVMQEGMASTIIVYGNPAVWFTGLYGFFFIVASNLASLFRGNKSNSNDWPESWKRSRMYRGAGFFLITAALAQFLPWAIIPRKIVFIYHYFASVPFITISWVVMLHWLTELWKQEKNNDIALRTALISAAAALVFFIAFYPTLSGTPFPMGWAQSLKMIFPKIYF